MCSAYVAAATVLRGHIPRWCFYLPEQQSTEFVGLGLRSLQINAALRDTIRVLYHQNTHCRKKQFACALLVFHSPCLLLLAFVRLHASFVHLSFHPSPVADTTSVVLAPLLKKKGLHEIGVIDRYAAIVSGLDGSLDTREGDDFLAWLGSRGLLPDTGGAGAGGAAERRAELEAFLSAAAARLNALVADREESLFGDRGEDAAEDGEGGGAGAAEKGAAAVSANMSDEDFYQVCSAKWWGVFASFFSCASFFFGIVRWYRAVLACVPLLCRGGGIGVVYGMGVVGSLLFVPCGLSAVVARRVKPLCKPAVPWRIVGVGSSTHREPHTTLPIQTHSLEEKAREGGQGHYLLSLTPPRRQYVLPTAVALCATFVNLVGTSSFPRLSFGCVSRCRRPDSGCTERCSATASRSSRRA